MSFIYAHNQFLPADAAFITADDRSFRFGDGMFETMFVANGKIYNWKAHLERIKAGLTFFRLNVDIAKLHEECMALLIKNECAGGYLRVVFSRGADPGAMGYLMGKNTKAYYVIQTMARDFPAYKSIALWVGSARAAIAVPCKINSAVHYTLSMLEAQEQGCDNALILDNAGHVCETASGNIFWVKNGMLHTPKFGLPFIPGTIRKKIMDAKVVRECNYTLEDLKGADEIFMSNVGGLITHVSAIKPLGYTAKDDTVTRELRHLIEADVRQETQALS